MVLQPDQHRVCTMLKDTITLLCKNGLVFKNKFSIEAVIGVTLDDKYMFHVSMNQVVESPVTPSAEEDGDNKSSSNEKVETNGHKQKRRKRRHMKQEAGTSEISNDEDVSDHNSLDTDRSPSYEKNSHNTTKHPPLSSKITKVESDYVPFGADGEEQDDIVFVKQEIDDNWSYSQADQSRMSVSQDHAQDQGYFHATNKDLTSQNNSGWHLVKQSSSSAVLGPESSQSSARMDQTSNHQKRVFICSICNKSCTTRGNLKKHENWHRGIYPYHCSYCNKGFMASNDLRAHLTNHTGIMQFRCDLCGKEFRYKKALQLHMSRNHFTGGI